MTSPEKIQTAMFLAGFLLIWASGQFELALLMNLGVALLGGGVTAGGYLQLLAARASDADLAGSTTSSQRIVRWLRGLLQTGIGLAVVFGALAAAFLGGEGLWRLLTGQPGPLLLATGAILVALSIEVVLAEGQHMTSRWQFLASLPLRLASLPLLALGLACLGFGAFALLLPTQFHAWIRATFGPFLPGP